MLVTPLRSQHRLNAVDDEDRVDEVGHILVAVAALSLALRARDAHRLQRHVDRVRANLRAAPRELRPIKAAALRRPARLLVNLPPHSAVWLVQKLRDRSIPISVRDRKDRKSPG